MLEEVKRDRNATELDELDRYRLLLWAINVARQRDVRMKNDFQPMLAPIEGNNRTGAHTYILLGAVYNANDDLMRCGTLSTKWIVDNIETEGTTRQSISNRYKNINLHDLTKSQILDNNSGFNKEFVNMTMIWGISKNEFDAINIDIKEVEQIDVNFSENRMKDKQNAITPPVTRQLSKQAQIYLNMMTDLEPVPSNESYTFSANASENGELYVHFQQDPVKIAKTTKPPPPCEIFSTDAWTRLVANPDETNLRHHMNSINVGSTFLETFQPPMKQTHKKKPSKQTRLVPSGNTRNPPFLLDRYNLFDRVGEVHKKKRDGKERADCTKNTEAARRNEMGLGHEPLGLEELMKAHFIALLLPTLCKAYYSIPLKGWHISPHYNESIHAVNYLIRTHVATSKSNNFAAELDSYWEEEEWYTAFGRKGRTPASRDCTYLAATLFLADMMVACLCVEGPDGELVNNIIAMLEMSHADTSGFNDIAVVETLGRFKKERSLLTKEFSSPKVYTHDRYSVYQSSELGHVESRTVKRK